MERVFQTHQDWWSLFLYKITYNCFNKVLCSQNRLSSSHGRTGTTQILNHALPGCALPSCSCFSSLSTLISTCLLFPIVVARGVVGFHSISKPSLASALGVRSMLLMLGNWFYAVAHLNFHRAWQEQLLSIVASLAWWH